MALRPGAGSLAVAVALVFAVWRGLVGDPVTDAFERRLLDLRFAWRGGWDASAHVAVVAVDEMAATAFGRAPSLRGAVAEAIPKIREGGARAIAVDLILADSSAADAALAGALASQGDAAVAAAVLQETAPGAGAPDWTPEQIAALERSAIPAVVGAPAALPIRRLLLPTPGLSSAARIGHVNLLRSDDGVVRAMPLALPTSEGVELPALPLASLALAAGRDIVLFRDDRVEIGRHRAPLDRGDLLVIDHVGGRGAIPTYGLEATLAGETPPGAFRDRIVFIGATADSLGDIFVTPLGKDVAGVEILAGVAAGLIEGRAIRRDALTSGVSIVLAAALALAGLAATRVERTGVALLASAAVVVVGLGAVQGAFSHGGLWLDGAAAAMAMALGLLAGGVRRFQAASGRAERMEAERDNLTRYVAPDLAERLAQDGSPGFERRPQDAAVLFVDVNGFTAFAEAAAPAAMTDFLALLHRYFESISERHQGVIVDFQGDGAMVVFGLPDTAPDDAARALACAGEMIDQASAPTSPFRLAGDLRLRAAVHFGPVVAAVLGGQRQAVVTLAGDTVNLASRLLETARDVGADLVTTRETLESAGLPRDGRGDYAFLERAQLRGRQGETDIFVRTEDGKPSA